MTPHGSFCIGVQEYPLPPPPENPGNWIQRELTRKKGRVPAPMSKTVFMNTI
jgi:hypothetical protein